MFSVVLRSWWLLLLLSSFGPTAVVQGATDEFNVYCPSSFHDKNGLEACEYDTRYKLIQTCPGTGINDYHSYKQWDEDTNRMGYGFLKMFGGSQVDPQSAEYWLSQPSDVESEDPSIQMYLRWSIWAMITACLAVLTIFAILLVVCPMYCCKCCRICCGCCTKPEGCCKDACPCCCTNYYLNTSTRKIILWSALPALGALVFGAFAIAYSSVGLVDTHTLDCSLVASVYQASYGSFEETEFGTPAFGGIARLDNLVHSLSSELGAAQTTVQNWNSNVGSLYTNALSSLYGPLLWTSFNLRSRSYAPWRSQDGRFPPVQLGHVVLADQVLFGINGANPLLDWSASYGSYLAVTSSVSSAFKLSQDTINSVQSSLASAEDAVNDLLNSVDFPKIYQTTSDVFDTVDDVHRVMVLEGNDFWVNLAYGLLIAFSVLAFLILICGGGASFYVHVKNKYLDSVVSQNPKYPHAWVLGLSSCSLLSLGFLFLLVAAVGIFAIVYMGDVCHFVNDDLFTENRYSEYPGIDEYITENLSTHCLTYAADGNILAAFGAEDIVNYTEESAKEMTETLRQIPLDVLFPQEIRSQLKVSIADSVKSFISDESNLYTQVIPDLANLPSGLLMTSSKVLFAGIYDVQQPIDQSTVSGTTFATMLGMPKFDSANFPSFKDFPWKPAGDGSLPAIGPYSDTRDGLSELIRQSNACGQYVDRICTDPDSTKCGPSDIIINVDHIFYWNASDFQSETSIRTLLSTQLNAQDPQSQEFFRCIALEPIPTLVQFMVGVYQTCFKGLMLSRIPAAASNVDSMANFDLCPLDADCYPFVRFNGTSVGNATMIPTDGESWASTLQEALVYSESQTSVESIGQYLTYVVSTYTPATQLISTAELINETYNCRTLFGLVLQPFFGACRRVSGDLAVVVFSWFLLGIVQCIIGFWIFAWFKGGKLPRDKRLREDNEVPSLIGTDLDTQEEVIVTPGRVTTEQIIKASFPYVSLKLD